MKKLFFFLFLIIGALLIHVSLTAKTFKLQWILQQKEVPSSVAAPVAITNDGTEIALEYRELNLDDNHMYAKISIWNMATGKCTRHVAGRLDDLIESQSFDGHLIPKVEQSQPFFSDSGERLGITRTTKAQRAKIRAKSIYYSDPEKINVILINGLSDITVKLGHNKPLIRFSPEGDFLALTMEHQVDILDVQTGQIVQQLSISLEAGQTILAFFFFYEDKLHLAVVCREQTQIWVLKA